MERIPLALRPTPLEPLTAPSSGSAATSPIWLKRDDLTGFLVSGNKIRKLELLLAEALEAGATRVITCGGIQSNHCRATAVAARRLGLESTLLLRHAERGAGVVPDGNLLLDRLVGARIIWVDRAGYLDRTARMEELAAASRAAGERPYIIPEGGSNGLGALGFALAGQEARAQAEAAGVEFDAVVCAVGSGGTAAGLALAPPARRVIGIPVCDDAAFFRARIEAICAEAAGRAAALGIEVVSDPMARLELVDGFVGRGYGLSRPEELAALRALAAEHAVVLDPVYTGKAWYALTRLREDGRIGAAGPVLFWHTGGAFGLFGRGAELFTG